MPDRDKPHGLVTTLLGLAFDSPMLVGRIESDTQRVDLEDVAEEALGVVEEVVVVQPLGELCQGAAT